MEVILADQKPFWADVKMIEAKCYTFEFQLITWPLEISQDAIQAVNFTNHGFKAEVEIEIWPE